MKWQMFYHGWTLSVFQSCVSTSEQQLKVLFFFSCFDDISYLFDTIESLFGKLGAGFSGKFFCREKEEEKDVLFI